MEQDQKLKELLLLGSERASTHFTAGVMKRVQGLTATPFYYQPLVSAGLKKAFLITVSVLVAAIFLVCLLLSSPDLTFPSWPAVQYVITFMDENSYTILAYIVCFWMMYAASAFVEKMRGRRYGGAF